MSFESGQRPRGTQTRMKAKELAEDGTQVPRSRAMLLRGVKG
jgi:hypothetical protein